MTRTSSRGAVSTRSSSRYGSWRHDAAGSSGAASSSIAVYARVTRVGSPRRCSTAPSATSRRSSGGAGTACASRAATACGRDSVTASAAGSAKCQSSMGRLTAKSGTVERCGIFGGTHARGSDLSGAAHSSRSTRSLTSSPAWRSHARLVRSSSPSGTRIGGRGARHRIGRVRLFLLGALHE